MSYTREKEYPKERYAGSPVVKQKSSTFNGRRKFHGYWEGFWIDFSSRVPA
jgi:hypothetical protein